MNQIAETLFELAQQQDRVGNARVSAALVYRNKVVSIGKNSYKTHPQAAKYSKNEKCNTIHAELDCLLRAARQLDERQFTKSTLVVVRAKYLKGKAYYGLAKPCSGCQKLIDYLGVGNVIYSTEEGMEYA